MTEEPYNFLLDVLNRADNKQDLIEAYEVFTRTTAVYPSGSALTYLTLGLTNEAGEVAGVLKKIIRDDDGTMSFRNQAQAKLSAELGDVLWYLTRLADELHISLRSLMVQNAMKLQDRKDRNVLKGSGDNR